MRSSTSAPTASAAAAETRESRPPERSTSRGASQASATSWMQLLGAHRRLTGASAKALAPGADHLRQLVQPPALRDLHLLAAAGDLDDRARAQLARTLDGGELAKEPSGRGEDAPGALVGARLEPREHVKRAKPIRPHRAPIPRAPALVPAQLVEAAALPTASPTITMRASSWAASTNGGSIANAASGRLRTSSPTRPAASTSGPSPATRRQPVRGLVDATWPEAVRAHSGQRRCSLGRCQSAMPIVSFPQRSRRSGSG